MSEELLQTIPQQIGKYTYYRLGATTLDQLKNHGIIGKKNYGRLKTKKPDGLVVYHGQVKVVVEYKQPQELKTKRLVDKAIAQEIEVAKALCKILVVTDGSKSYWINALNGEPIKDPKGNDLRTVFHPFVVKNTVNLEFLIGEVDASIDKDNSTIRSAKLIDPTPLATRLWQTIWVATGKSPVKCLYNVVELFIFKFLSDLKVLDEDISFAKIYQKAQGNAEDGLDFYARNTRKKIYQLFPQGADGTTIINGTIFVNEKGDANLSQSILFLRSLEHLQRYTEDFGSLTKIDKQFKTKLYESFLKQEVEALGQYFTPRKVIQSVIRMAGADSPQYQFDGKRICDPFCGVGGFPLELLNMNERMRECYVPDSTGKITVPFTLHGFDKGFEREDERTIILAKANMLIYLAEILFANPKCSRQFAEVFNGTFRLFKDNLGTFGHIIKDESEKYDIILSNPPYVTRGSSIIKEEIRKTPRTANEYPVNALGLEGLSIEWIIRTLKRGGRTYLIVPDGIFGRIGGKKLRNYILDECYLDAIVSLPVRTFFANWEHTYILVLTKKNRPDDVQTEPVFTYIATSIGEKLTSVKREEIEDDDLPEMENLFKLFMADRQRAKALVEPQSGRCKIQEISRFRDEMHWVVNRWWTKDELRAINALDSNTTTSLHEVDQLLIALKKAAEEYNNYMADINLSDKPVVAVELGRKDLFKLFIGKRVLTKDVTTDASRVPVYSANVRTPMGYIERSNIDDFTRPAVLWGIDGNFEFSIMPRGIVYASTDHCGTIRILSDAIDPEYLLYALHVSRIEEDFDRSFRASLTLMKKFSVLIPVKKDGSLDIDEQRKIAKQFIGSQERLAKMNEIKAKLDEVYGHYVGTMNVS